jgi:hypothetical protein
MDFDKILADNLISSIKSERVAFYSALNDKLLGMLEKNGISSESKIARNYTSRLELAIERHENTVAPTDNNELENAALLSPQTSEKNILMSNPILRAGPISSSEPLRPLDQTQVHAKASGGMFKLAAVMLTGVVLGYLATSFVSGSDSSISSSYSSHAQSEAARYEKNVGYLKSADAALRQYQQRSGRYPESENFAALTTVVKGLAGFAAPSLPEGANADRLYYKSNGRDFKLMFNRSGDCFLARIKNPELVDAGRASGPIDCQDYGMWTEGGMAF